MSSTKYIATDKDPSDLPPQARAIVKAAKHGATKERVLKSLEGGKQKPGRILSYYKTMLVKKGYIKIEEKEPKAKKPAKKAKAAPAPAPVEAPADPAPAPAETPAATE